MLITELSEKTKKWTVSKGNNFYFWSNNYFRACIKQLPNILVVVLKRFELNYDTMTHSKFNGRFEFPNNINMREYTVEYIEKQSILKELEKVSIEDLDDRKREILQINYPDDYYEYSLKGIVIHSGEANSGHYYS